MAHTHSEIEALARRYENLRDMTPEEQAQDRYAYNCVKPSVYTRHNHKKVRVLDFWPSGSSLVMAVVEVDVPFEAIQTHESYTQIEINRKENSQSYLNLLHRIIDLVKKYSPEEVTQQ